MAYEDCACATGPARGKPRLAVRDHNSKPHEVHRIPLHFPVRREGRRSLYRQLPLTTRAKKGRAG